MNKYIFIFLLVLACLLSQNVWSLKERQLKFPSWKDHWLTIAISTPPALMFVTDSQGRRTGTDPSVPVNKFGIGDFLQEIPLSLPIRENLGSDEKQTLGQPSGHTTWTDEFYDATAQVYTVNLMGMSTGVSHIFIGAGYSDPKISPDLPSLESDIRILISKGVTRQAKVMFDPEAKMITTQRVMRPIDLIDDTDTACQLDLIPSKEICKSLKKKAEEVKEAIGKGDKDEAREELEAFLDELKSLTGDGKGDDDREHKGQVKEPAATILREEAQTLLKGLGDGGQKNDQGKDHKRAEKKE